ncbi:unnamed protein product [Clonostachys chloroleuca]|uniref:Protein kinase domain-containing protein n=1 Tax=Clonostachys chloroleuca TaxID=1926264 RepID=A0AA35M7U0_9HYPO|nr:unnamed protein product [Clonostachys chloroleuca]
MALLRRTSPKEEFPKHHEDDPAWWQSEIEGEPTPLQDRLIEANLRRRNRFLYAQRHSKMLAIQQAPAKEPVAILPVPDREEVSSPKQIGVTDRQVSDNDVRETKNSLVLAPMSLTLASDIDSNLNLEERKIAFQASKTQITSITGATDDGHCGEEHGLLQSKVEPSTTAESAIQTVQSPIFTWLDGLDMPGPEERDDSVAVLDKLKDSRTENSGNRRDDHFVRSPYFASDSEVSTQDAQLSKDPSFVSESEASTQDSQRDGSSSSSAWAEEEELLEVREIRDHGEELHYDDFPPQRRRIPDPEKWTQVDDLIREIRLALDAAKARYQFDASNYFVPRSKFAEIMKPQKVLELVHGLECFQDKSNEQKQQIAQDICFGSNNQRPSLKVLGALVASNQVGDLARHTQNGLTDGCLPLRQYGDNKFYHCFQCSDSNHTAAMNDPNDAADDRETFAQWTKKLIPPYIRYQLGVGLHCHYIFEDGNCLPIESSEEIIPGHRNPGSQSVNGSYEGFSEVFRVKIHDSHHSLEDNGMRNSRGYYALKKLTSHDRKDFELELSTLLYKADRNRSREHMIQLLATFEEVNTVDRQSTYYLLFDFADGNLEDFWQSNESLVQDKSHCLLAEQFLELGKALQNLHNGVDSKSHGGRHGDLKPSNILFFKPQGESHPAFADFATYRSPEFDLPGGLVGPRSDVYSLGCVFLEYITWFLRGPVLERFSEERIETDIYGFDADTFFTIEGNEQNTAVIKPAVKRWIESLKEEEACSWYLIRMLALVETKMMRVDKDKRISTRALVKKLETLRRICQRTPSFYTENWKQ